MAESNELGRTQVVTQDGIVTAIVLDKISSDRMALNLIKGSAAAIYGRVEDATPLVPRAIKDLLVVPFSEL
ncbi:MAG TPA: hypothetical protein VLA34_08865 [Candidatus Krumholzibacterium sp.]|nr:hypothetical protein [Candidatus Krumholzibacterium sp.]